MLWFKHLQHMKRLCVCFSLIPYLKLIICLCLQIQSSIDKDFVLKLDVYREIFCFSEWYCQLDSTRCKRLFHSHYRSWRDEKRVEEKREERIEIGAITTLNDSHYVRPFLCFFSSFPSEGKRERAKSVLYSSLKLPRFTTESHSFKLLSNLNTVLARDTQAVGRICTYHTHLNAG